MRGGHSVSGNAEEKAYGVLSFFPSLAQGVKCDACDA